MSCSCPPDCFSCQELKQASQSESKQDVVNGTFYPISRIAVEEGDGVCGWIQVDSLDAQTRVRPICR